MISISACMIVKNEERILARCLDSMKDLVDEIIIVDTGSDDNTKNIALEYTDKVYDFVWADDFASARNYSFSKASMEYIYVADADEVIDLENQNRFLLMKKVLLSEIEIVQMYYANQLQYNTTYNFDKEYRPKLYKRLREFQWMDPLHESVRLDPIIWDSEIEIVHMPECSHAKRDFHIYGRMAESGLVLSSKLRSMYARELFVSGEEQDFLEARRYFSKVMNDSQLSEEELRICQCVMAKTSRISGDVDALFKICLKNAASGHPSAEICYELGEYYQGQNDDREAVLWFYHAAYETEAELNIHYRGDYPLLKLSQCCLRLGNEEDAAFYKNAAELWNNESLHEKVNI